MAVSRRHSRIQDDLPPEIREEVDRLLIEGGGITYDDIKDFLAERGYDISRSAIGRYGKHFLAVYQQVRIVEEKSKVLTSESGAGLVLEEAATKILLQQVLGDLMDGDLMAKDRAMIMSSLAKLQASSVLRERLKKEISDKAKKAASEAEDIAREGGLSDEAVELIKRKILGVAE